MEPVLSAAPTREGSDLSYPTPPCYLKSKVNVFLVIFCLLQASPPLWLLFDLLSALGPQGRQRELCVCESREDEPQLLLTCLYSSEREKSTANIRKKSTVCKATLEIGNTFVCCRERADLWKGQDLGVDVDSSVFLPHFCIRKLSMSRILSTKV